MNTARGMIVWLTGLSGAGKSTLADEVYRQLQALNMAAEVLDGDALRAHINRDLGFSRRDRDENVRRIGYIASLLSAHGVIVLVAVVSPYRAARDAIRSAAANGFVEVHVDAPVEVCEQRDTKGLYKKARSGGLTGFTGLDDPYEAPAEPEVHCRTDIESPQQSVARIMAAILQKR